METSRKNETDIAERLLKPSGFSPRRKQLQSVQDSRTSSHSYSAALCGLLFLRKRNMQKKNLFSSSNIVVLGAAYLKDWPEIYPVVAHAQHISPFCNFLGNLCRNLNHIVLLFCGTLYTSATWFWFRPPFFLLAVVSTLTEPEGRGTRSSGSGYLRRS